MLLVVYPLTLIFSAVEVLKHAVSVGFVVCELAYVVLTIGEYLPAVPMLLVVPELSLVLGAIRPEHNAHSVLPPALLQPSE